MDRDERSAGCLVGQAVGDMVGLPYENLSRRRVGRLARFDQPRFFFGSGCGSDDTEHAGLTAEALAFANDDVEAFRRRLASGLRRWFLAGPPGIGFATLKSCAKLCIGVPPARSGVFSAGNGPAMRAAILGVLVPPGRLAAFVEAATVVTHTDPRALAGALVVAELAQVADTVTPADGPAWLRAAVARTSGDLEPLTRNLLLAADSLTSGATVAGYAAAIGCGRGVSGFIAHTVPVAAFAFFRHADDYRAAVEAVVRCGGDTDTVAAITGALVGSRVGVDCLPAAWRDGHRDWPWSLANLVECRRPPLLAWPAVFARNLAFFAVVLVHVARRLLPPW